MNVQIITSSYPAFTGDPGGTAGLFVQSFAEALASQGHNVVIQPVARKQSYESDNHMTIEPIPWSGGDRELASMNFFNPLNWIIFLKFFIDGIWRTQAVNRKYKIDHVLCMWVIPSGLFGYWIKKRLGKSYDIWALGSDIWKIKKIPFFGKYWIKTIARNADQVFADGVILADDVKIITGRQCQFLPSSRNLPSPEVSLPPLQPAEACHMIYVGRYHKNKGPDLLLHSLCNLSSEAKSKICVHMFGAGPMEHELKALIGQLNVEHIVDINGPINAQEFANYLNRVAYLLIPSRIESIPLVFSDALQIGVPVISTPVGDLKKLIIDYRCGNVSEEVTAKSYSLAIEEALITNNNELRQNTLSACADFKIENSVAQWIKRLHEAQKGAKINVEIKKGITVPEKLLRESEQENMSFNFWYGKPGSDFVSVMLKAKPSTIVVSDNNGNTAYIPCFNRKILPGVSFLNGYPYSRVFGNQELFFNNIASVIDACTKNHVAKIELLISGKDLDLIDLIHSKNNECVDILSKAQYTRQILDISHLSKAGDLISAFTGKIRWSINKATKGNVRCKKINEEPVTSVQNLYTQIMREKGAPVYYNQNRFQHIVNYLTPAGSGFIYLAYIGFEPVGMAAVLYADNTAFLLQIAAPRKFAQHRVGDLLIATAQYEAACAGKQYFDFMATPEFEPGVKDYKAKWGGSTERVETISITVSQFQSRLIDALRVLSRKCSSFFRGNI